MQKKRFSHEDCIINATIDCYFNIGHLHSRLFGKGLICRFAEKMHLYSKLSLFQRLEDFTNAFLKSGCVLTQYTGHMKEHVTI